jgi:thiamine-monophosphate kinase
MHQPTPRIELGLAIRELASAALDVSDGLLGDLKHILNVSHVDAEIQLNDLPKSVTLQKQSLEIQNQFAACGGDDYEICFTAPNAHRGAIDQLSKTLKLPLTRIGKITPKKGTDSKISITDASGNMLSDEEATSLQKSFDHFAS